ncbi:MAG: cytochrome C [Calditrichaeota bacterium]|nr:cytochrome C [Calditrichota bacterium]MBT7788562.1 cytochrome C [Calditrichota bacterium]
MLRSTTLLTSVFLVLLANLSFGQISPGKLSRYHIELEGIENCTKCHELGNDVSNEKCLDCHQTLRGRIASERGYHSSKAVKDKQCAKCHSDHHGREFELIYWENGIEEFNHLETGYTLETKHNIKDCRKCHKPDFILSESVKSAKNLNPQTTFLGLESQACISCHQDEHVNQLTDMCLDCHNYSNWAPAPEFNHDSTRYPLTGKHIEVLCDKCHQSIPADAANQHLISKHRNSGTYIRYSDLAFTECHSCHKDLHDGKFGGICSECHKTSGFNEVKFERDKFDHSRTGYNLAGAHKSVECNRCHVKNLTASLKCDHCQDCHKDEHQGQFSDREDGGACESCHNLNNFSPPDYDIPQHQTSDYPLTGSHLATPCFLCHSPIDDGKVPIYARFDFEDKTCSGCHNDTHNGQADKWLNIGGCEYCHITESWRKVESFNHESSQFKLLGKHIDLNCSRCHYSIINDGDNVKVILKPIDTKCLSCHRDPHNGQFDDSGKNESADFCHKCHDPSGWSDLKFEHNRDSRYKLDGAHFNLSCEKCHPILKNENNETYILYKPLGSECSDCHGKTNPSVRDK